MAENLRKVTEPIRAVSDSVEINVSDAGSIMFSVASMPSPSVSLISEIFNPAGEWVAVQVWQNSSSAPTLSSSAIIITGAVTYVANVPNATLFRVRCTAFTSEAVVSITACEAVISVPPMSGATQKVQVYNALGVINYSQAGYNLVSAASTNDTLIGSGTKYLTDYDFSNSGAAVCYVKLYNKSTAPTSADTPQHVVMVPAGGRAGMSYSVGLEKRFSNGFGIRITGLSANNDATAVAAGQVTVSIGYN